MAVHEVKAEDSVVVFIEGLGYVNVDALKGIFEEIELQESLSVQNDYDRGSKWVSCQIHKKLLSNVVDGTNENMVTSENAAAARAWEEGEKAGVQNQMNWDGWNMTKPSIENPYKGASS